MKKLLSIIISLAGITLSSNSNAGITETAVKYNLVGNFVKGVKASSPLLVGAIIAKAGEKTNSNALQLLGSLTLLGGVPFFLYKDIQFALNEKYPNQDQDLKETKSTMKKFCKRIIPYIPFILAHKIIIIPASAILNSMPNEEDSV